MHEFEGVMDLSVLLDPNLVYLVLVTGIWLAVTAAYMPGTGIVELGAAGLVIGGLLLLAGMPTNWLAALMVLVGGVLFLVVPFIEERHTVLALGGLALQLIGSVFLFNGVSVSLWLIAAVAIVSLAYYRYVLIPILRTHRQSAALRTDRPLIGEYGRVQSILNPTGTVRVQGESWSARLSEQSSLPVPVDASVVVLDREGLVLIVAPEEPKRKHEPDSEE
jgi:membrane-bound serine protease (ClpP class)